MSSSRTWGQEGGAAFPVQPCDELAANPGMSLRDYFAAKAVAGMLADHTRDAYPYELAETAYKIADAMLTERAK